MGVKPGGSVAQLVKQDAVEKRTTPAYLQVSSNFQTVVGTMDWTMVGTLHLSASDRPIPLSRHLARCMLAQSSRFCPGHGL